MRHLALLGGLAAATVSLAVAAPVSGAGDGAEEAQAWRSAFEGRARVELGRRMIVVLAAPSLADHVARTGRLPSAKAQRRLVAEAERLQRRLLAALRAQGVVIRPERSFTRTFNGFSAVLDAPALAALERAPGVVGVYPARAVYLASVSAEALAGDSGALPPAVSLTGADGLLGADGAGVTVALLDTGVDAGHPVLAGRVLPEVRLTGRGGGDEAHGTRMAGIVAASAPGARILPIRVLGAKRAGEGAVGRGDLLLAGLERAVDPDGDGDVEDAARIALVPVVEPYAAFPESPEARAAAGALALGTLVVAAAGNDGAAGLGFGTVGAPASAPAALAVGAADLRPELPAADVTVLAGGEVVFRGTSRVLGGLAPEAPAGGPAAVVAADGTPLAPKVRAARAAGAAVVLVWGSLLPAGTLPLDEEGAVPVVTIPVEVGRALAAAAGVSATVTPAPAAANPEAAGVAGFSSRGPAFDGRVKPDVVAAGVGIATADAGAAPDGSARYATVTGSSAAAAVAAAAAALVAQARPDLDASELRSVLVGSARPLAPGGAVDPVSAQGAGLVDPEAARAAELVVEPASLAFGRGRDDGWGASQAVRVRNASPRPLDVHFELVREAGEGTFLSFFADPAELSLEPGEAADVRIAVALAEDAPRPSAVSGWLVAAAPGAPPARVPWAVPLAPSGPVPLVAVLGLSRGSFAPSEKPAAALSFRAGLAAETAHGVVVEPVALLDVELWSAGGRRLGVLLRLRDLLPGRYAIGLTGHGPDGRPLPPGRYVVKLRAQAVDALEGRAGRAVAAIGFTIVPATP